MLKRVCSSIIRFFGRLAYRLYLAAGLLLVTVVVLFTLFPQLLTGFHTALFVTQVLNVPVKPQAWFTQAPVREEITYERPDQLGEADVYYIPDGQRRAALLVFLGANAAGRDDRDVVNFGNALARAGYVPMFSWSPTMGLQNNVDPAEVENLVLAFQHLRGLDYVDPARVGMAGFSVGGSFVMVAASDARIRDDVHFVNAFGAYYDARDFFVQIASSTKRSGDTVEPWDVDRLTRRVFTNELIEVAPAEAERNILTRRFVENAQVTQAELDGLAGTAALSRRLLDGTDPREAETPAEPDAARFPGRTGRHLSQQPYPQLQQPAAHHARRGGPADSGRRVPPPGGNPAEPGPPGLALHRNGNFRARPPRRRPAAVAPGKGRQQALRPHVRHPPHGRVMLSFFLSTNPPRRTNFH